MLATVIIPVYNCEKYVEHAVRSVMKQTYKNLQIVIINDGSTDRTKTILDKLTLEDSRILLINKENEGVSKARNDGLALAVGEYIFFFDGDDFIAPDCIEKCIRFGNEYKLDAVMYGYTSVGMDGTKDRHRFSLNKYFFESNKEILDFILPRTMGIRCEEILLWIKGKRKHIRQDKDLTGPWIMAYRKKIIDKDYLRFNEALFVGEDTVFVNTYLALCQRVALLDEPFYFLNHHEDSTIGQYSRNLTKMINNKIKLAYAKEEITEKIMNETGCDISSYWGGEIILSIIQIALLLCMLDMPFHEQKKHLKDFINCEVVCNNINKLELYPIIKIKMIPVVLVKLRAISLLLFVCKCANKLHIKAFI